MERLNKAREEKERIKNMTSRGVPKPKNPTSLAAIEKQDDSAGQSLLGVGTVRGDENPDGGATDP